MRVDPHKQPCQPQLAHIPSRREAASDPRRLEPSIRDVKAFRRKMLALFRVKSRRDFFKPHNIWPSIVAVLIASGIALMQWNYGGLYKDFFTLDSYLLVGLAGCVAFFQTGFVKATYLFSRLSLIAVIAAALWLLFIVGLSPEPRAAASASRLIVAGLCVYLTVAVGLRETRHRLLLLILLLLVAFVQSLIGLWQFIRDPAFMAQGWMSELLREWYVPRYEVQYVSRARGFFLNANQLAWFLNSCGLMALCLGVFWRLGRLSQTLWLYFGALFLAGSTLSLSRGGFIGMGAGLVALVVLAGIFFWSMPLQNSRPERLFAIITGSIVTLALIGFGISTVSNRTTLDRYFADSFREVAWSSAMQQIAMAPVIGGGPGSFKWIGRFTQPQATGTDMVFVHNDWLQLIAEYGLIAGQLIAIVTLIHLWKGGVAFWIWARLFGSRRPTFRSRQYGILAGALTVLVMAVAHSFFDFNMQVPANALLACAMLGLSVRRNPVRRRGQPRRRTALVFLTPAALGGLWLILMSTFNRPFEFSLIEAENVLLRGRVYAAERIASLGLRGRPKDPAMNRIAGEAAVRRALEYTSAGARAEAAKKALPFLETAIAGEPRNSFNYLWLAIALDLAREHEKAETFFIQAVRMAPLISAPWEQLGWHYETQGNLEKAVEAYQKAASLPRSTFAGWRLPALRAHLGEKSVESAESKPLPLRVSPRVPPFPAPFDGSVEKPEGNH